VLYLDVKLPRPDHDSASLRASQLLCYLAGRADVDLAVISDYGFGPDAERQAASLGARLAGAAGSDAVRAHIKRHGPDYDLVLFAWSRTATAFMTDVQRAAPRAFRVFDTVDVNHVREFRHARVTGNANRLRTALRLRALEASAIAAADVTLAITDADRTTLTALVPGARIELVGQYSDPETALPRKIGAPTVLFVGHYQAAPNHDAAMILARTIMPLVRAFVPDAVLQLAGSDPGLDTLALAAEDVIVPGWEADLRPRLAGAGVFAAPLRFGSGVKGKILQAIAHRVPLVASAVAIEGTGLKPGRDYIAAETPAEFADGIAAVLSDPAMRERLAENAMEILRKRFSRRLVRRQLDAALGPLLRGR
jgi:O-antigen biosynthesis protein